MLDKLLKSFGIDPQGYIYDTQQWTNTITEALLHKSEGESPDRSFLSGKTHGWELVQKETTAGVFVQDQFWSVR